MSQSPFFALTPNLIEALAHPAVPAGQLLWFCDEQQFRTYAEPAKGRGFALYAPDAANLPRMEELVERASSDPHVLVGCCDGVSAAVLLQGFVALAAENLPSDRLRTVLVSGSLTADPLVKQQAALLCEKASELGLRVVVVPDAVFPRV